MTEAQMQEILILHIRRLRGTESEKALLFLTDCANGRLPDAVFRAFCTLLLSQLSMRGIDPKRYWAGRDDQLLFPYDRTDQVPDTVCEVRQILSVCGLSRLSMGGLGALMQPGVRKYSKGQLLLMRSKLKMMGKDGDQVMGMQGMKDLCDACCDRAVWSVSPNPYGQRWNRRVRDFLQQVACCPIG